MNVGRLSPIELEPWLTRFLSEVERETAILRVNGALSQAAARDALVNKLVEHATCHYDAMLTVPDVAKLLGASFETARRKVRSGELTAHRNGPRGKIHVRRADVMRLVGGVETVYDPIADAQDVAHLRREAV